MEAFLQHLTRSAFDNLDISSHSIDLHGWMCETFAEMFRNGLLKKSKNDKIRIIEVGSWKGLSTVTMAQECKHMGYKNVDIIAVDTWLGAPEFWTWGLNDPTRRISLNAVNGYPSVFYTFTKNVKARGHHDMIRPFPISSVQGAEVLKHYNMKADIIYVDASHEYEAVLQDIEKYWDILDKGGMIFGDDYTKYWPGVIKAVDEFAEKNDLKTTINGVVWSIQKPLL